MEKTHIQKAEILTSGPITLWQVAGGKVGTVTDFILGSFRITSDVNFSHTIKRCLLLGRKAMTNLAC